MFRDLLTLPPITKTVKLPQGSFTVKVMSGLERFELETKCFGTDVKSRNFSCEVLTRTLCNDVGVREFTDDEAAEVAKAPSTIIDTLFHVAYELNEFGKKGEEDAKKNLGKIPPSGSGSNSPSN